MVLTKPQVRARLDLLFDEMPLLAAAVAKQKEAIGLMRLIV